MKHGTKVALGIAGGLAGAVALYEVGHQIHDNYERSYYWDVARAYSDAVGKPLLVVGMKRWPWQPPDGDVTVDLDPAVLGIPGGVQANELSMPFSDKQFGACYNAHTLEHMASAEDVETAVNECLRVAEIAIFLCPSPYSIVANMFCPSHNLRLWFDNDNNRIIVRPNNWRTEIGWQPGPRNTAIEAGQSMVAYEPLKVPLVISR
jgi:SAM-dependent methyltransferase